MFKRLARWWFGKPQDDTAPAHTHKPVYLSDGDRLPELASLLDRNEVSTDDMERLADLLGQNDGNVNWRKHIAQRDD